MTDSTGPRQRARRDGSATVANSRPASTLKWLIGSAILCAIFVTLIWISGSFPIAVCAMDGECPNGFPPLAATATIAVAVPLAIGLALAGKGRRRAAIGLGTVAVIVGALLALFFVAISQLGFGLVWYLFG